LIIVVLPLYKDYTIGKDIPLLKFMYLCRKVKCWRFNY